MQIFKGNRGHIELTEDSVRIIKKSMLEKTLRELRLIDLSAIQFSPGGFMTNGFIKFCRGTEPGLHDIEQAKKDESAIVFGVDKNKEFRALKELIEQKVAKIRAGSTNSNSNQPQSGNSFLNVLPPVVQKKDKNKVKEIGGGIFAVFALVIWFFISGDDEPEKVKNYADTIIAKDEKEQATVQKATAKRAEDAEDKRAAQNMGISYETYKRAKEKWLDALGSCHMMVKLAARYGAEDVGLFSGKLTANNWTTNGQTIQVTSDDIIMKNAFNAEQQVTYTCSYDIASGKTTIISVQ